MEAALHEAEARLQPAAVLLRLSGPALKSSCLHGKAFCVYADVCACVSPLMSEWHAVDRTAAVHPRSPSALQEVLKKSTETRLKEKVHPPHFYYVCRLNTYM